MSKELKDCPFCGAVDPYVDTIEQGEYRVFCSVCDQQGPMMRNREAAVKAWNTRTSHPLPTEEEVARVIEQHVSGPARLHDDVKEAHQQDLRTAARAILSMLRREEC